MQVDIWYYRITLIISVYRIEWNEASVLREEENMKNEVLVYCEQYC